MHHPDCAEEALPPVACITLTAVLEFGDDLTGATIKCDNACADVHRDAPSPPGSRSPKTNLNVKFDQQRDVGRHPITPDVRLYHRAVVVAQEATGDCLAAMTAPPASEGIAVGLCVALAKAPIRLAMGH